jgi:hypothetical protein
MVPAQRRRQDGGSSSDVNGCQLELRLVCVPEEFLAEEIDGHRSCDTDPMRHRTSALCWEPRGWRGGRLPRAAELLQPEDGAAPRHLGAVQILRWLLDTERSNCDLRCGTA